MTTATQVTKDVTEKVARIVKNTLDKRFGNDDIVFDRIIVEPKIDHYGDEYIDILIVYVGDRKILDPGWTVGLVRRILPKMEAEGIYVTNVPSKSFIPKFEWEQLQRWLNAPVETRPEEPFL